MAVVLALHHTVVDRRSHGFLTGPDGELLVNGLGVSLDRVVGDKQLTRNFTERQVTAKKTKHIELSQRPLELRGDWRSRMLRGDWRSTATTASALMIGLALVSTALAVGQSIKKTVSTTISESATADFFVTDQLEEVEFPLGLPDELRENDMLASVTGFRYVETRVGGKIGLNTAADFTELANGAIIDATITGIFHDEALVTSDFLFDDATFDLAGDTTGHAWPTISFVKGLSQAEMDATIATGADQFPAADVEPTEQFVDRAESMIDEMLPRTSVSYAGWCDSRQLESPPLVQYLASRSGCCSVGRWSRRSQSPLPPHSWSRSARSSFW